MANEGADMNRSISAEYLHDNFRPGDRLAIVVLNRRSGHVLQRLATAAKISEPRYQAWLRHLNARRYEVYISMNTLNPGAHGRKKADIRDVRHIYLDLDEGGQGKLDAILLRKDLPTPNWILQSSPGKFQVVWKVDGFSVPGAEELMRCLAESTGADSAATDASRVLRLPGFRNHKYGGTGYEVSVTLLHTEVSPAEEFGAIKALRTGHDSRELAPHPQRRNAGDRLSQSERDWAYARRALRRGEPVQKIGAAIEKHRQPDKAKPHEYASVLSEKYVEEVGGVRHTGVCARDGPRNRWRLQPRIARN